MSQDTNVNNLIINKMTQAQYESITPSDTELYFITDAETLPDQTGQSGKFLTTNGTVPSWSEVDSLPSQTGKTGKFLQTNGTEASWESAPFRNIGERVASTIPLVDAGLHLLDGALIQGSGIYSAFVDYIAGLYGDGTNIPSYFCTEQEWQTSVTNYGACDKYVYDNVNNTVRLPKRTSEHGDLIASSSSGTEWYRVYSDGWCEQGGLGTITTSGFGTITFLKPFANTNYNLSLTKNSSDSSSWTVMTYIQSNTNSIAVIKANLTGYVLSVPWYACGYTDISNYQYSPIYEYIVIATSTKTDIEVDIDEIATDLNGKVDKSDLAEVQCVVETYVNGTSGYRIYSDGYCEQWGRITGYSGWQTQAVTFLKPFKDMNYNITACHTRRTGSAYNDYSVSGVINPSTTGMSLNYYGTDTTGTIWWRASGYIEV